MSSCAAAELSDAEESSDAEEEGRANAQGEETDPPVARAASEEAARHIAGSSSEAPFHALAPREAAVDQPRTADLHALAQSCAPRKRLLGNGFRALGHARCATRFRAHVHRRDQPGGA